MVVYHKPFSYKTRGALYRNYGSMLVVVIMWVPRTNQRVGNEVFLSFSKLPTILLLIVMPGVGLRVQTFSRCLRILHSHPTTLPPEPSQSAPEVSVVVLKRSLAR